MIIKEKTPLDTAEEFVKIAVDIKREIISMECLMHVDCAQELVEDGSDWSDIWGAGIYPKKREIDFLSLINIRPKIGNRSMEIHLQDIREKVESIIKKLLL
ncbi:MAG: DUF5674 family protein [bacterium]|nr:DUF5674 family protein [bacterium]